MRMKSALVAVCLGLLALFGPVGPAVAQDDGPSAKCMMCHGADHEKMARSAHAVTADSRNFGCVGCHGMSEKHADDPASEKPEKTFRGKAGLKGAAASETCLMCHEANNKKMLLWHGSAHPQADVACTDCHKLHTNKDPVFSKAAQANVCFACHKNERVASNRASRHPIQEGKVGCSDCHSVHGAAGPKLAKRDSTNATCYQCHAEKRGPFVHNHEPVQQNCASCHNPHGSNVPGMLVARDPILCNQCHVPHVTGGVGALAGQRGVYSAVPSVQSVAAVTPLSDGRNVVNMWQGRSCLNCHTLVHGSNNPSARGPAPSNLFR